MLTGRQRLTDTIGVYSDVLWSRRYFGQIQTDYLGAGFGDTSARENGSADNLNIAAGAHYDFLPKWSAEVNGLFARQHTQEAEPITGPATLAIYGVPLFLVTQGSSFDEKSVELLLNGKLAQTSAGDIGTAVGVSYRDENASDVAYTQGTESGQVSLDRTVRSYYGEITCLSSGIRMPNP